MNTHTHASSRSNSERLLAKRLRGHDEAQQRSDRLVAQEALHMYRANERHRQRQRHLQVHVHHAILGNMSNVQDTCPLPERVVDGDDPAKTEWCLTGADRP